VIIYLGFNGTASFSLEPGLKAFRVIEVYPNLDFGPANGFYWQSDHCTIPVFKHVADRLVTGPEEVETHGVYAILQTRTVEGLLPVLFKPLLAGPTMADPHLSLGVVSVREEAR
jgi:hypothetical protein